MKNKPVVILPAAKEFYVSLAILNRLLPQNFYLYKVTMCTAEYLISLGFKIHRIMHQMYSRQKFVNFNFSVNERTLETFEIHIGYGMYQGIYEVFFKHNGWINNQISHEETFKWIDSPTPFKNQLLKHLECYFSLETCRICEWRKELTENIAKEAEQQRGNDEKVNSD